MLEVDREVTAEDTLLLNTEEEALLTISSTSLDKSRYIQGEKTFRAPINAEALKFKDPKREQAFIQMKLGEIPPAEQKPEIEAFHGLEKLSLAQHKALDAIHKLLDITDYKGNIEGEGREDLAFSSAFQGHFPNPGLNISFDEYLQAYGLKKDKKRRGRAGEYHSNEKKEALEALKGLEEQRDIIYKRKRFQGSGKGKVAVYDLIKTRRPLVQITWGYEGLSEQEAELVTQGREGVNPNRIQIEVSPLLLDQVDSFFIRKSYAMHQEIFEAREKKTVSSCFYLFHCWLLTLDLPDLRVSMETLANKLGLDYLIKNRHKKELRDTLRECCEVAKKCGYLLEYDDQTAFDLFNLTLNPERCNRVKPWKRLGRPEKQTQGQQALPETGPGQ